MVARRTRPRKILAFPLGGPEIPSSRLRIYCYRDRFRREGVRFAVYEDGAKGFWRGLRNLYNLLTSDVFFVQKRIFGLRRMLFCRLLGKRIVLDIDEATFIRQDTGQEDRKSSRALRRFLRHCHLLVLCNGFLRERLTRPGLPVLNLLTVPLETPATRPHRIRGLPRLGWVGSGNNLRYLEALDGVFCALQARYPFELTVIGPRDGHANLRANHRYLSWNRDIDRALSEHFDVGLMPLPEDDWTRGQCGCEIIRYQSCGLPAIASPVGINAELIEHGATGLLARDDREWHDCLELLLQNPVLVPLMSRRILDQYPERYSVQRNFERLFAAICEIVARRSGDKP